MQSRRFAFGVFSIVVSHWLKKWIGSDALPGAYERIAHCQPGRCCVLYADLVMWWPDVTTQRTPCCLGNSCKKTLANMTDVLYSTGYAISAH